MDKMISYKKWKSLNESILPSYNLGVANPSNLGLQAPSGFGVDLDEAKKMSKKKMDGDDDLVMPARDADDPDVDVDVADDAPDAGGCGGDMCNKMSKKKSGKKSEKKSKKKMWSDEDDAAPVEDEVEDEGEEEVEGDEGEEMAPEEGDELQFSKKKSKKSSKKGMKKEGTDEDQWWNSVKSMTGPDPDTKYTSGCEDLFTKVDTENLTQAVRSEPEVG